MFHKLQQRNQRMTEDFGRYSNFNQRLFTPNFNYSPRKQEKIKIYKVRPSVNYISNQNSPLKNLHSQFKVIKQKISNDLLGCPTLNTSKYFCKLSKSKYGKCIKSEQMNNKFLMSRQLKRSQNQTLRVSQCTKQKKNIYQYFIIKQLKQPHRKKQIDQQEYETRYYSKTPELTLNPAIAIQKTRIHESFKRAFIDLKMPNQSFSSQSRDKIAFKKYDSNQMEYKNPFQKNSPKLQPWMILQEQSCIELQSSSH